MIDRKYNLTFPLRKLNGNLIESLRFGMTRFHET